MYPFSVNFQKNIEKFYALKQLKKWN